MKRVITFLMLVIWALPIRAQEQKRPDSVELYRLDYVMFEIEDGKRTNERTYTMNAGTNRRPSILRVGTRVPLPSGDKGINYMDVGLRISATIDSASDGLTLETRFDLNSVVPSAPGEGGGPLLRTLETSNWNLVILGKPVIVGIVDDVNSKKRFQIEVTASKAK